MADEETINKMTQAAAKADDAILRDILTRSPRGTVNMPNRYGRTAIQVMNSMSPSTAQILLDHGADPNVPDPDVQRTILHDIAEAGCLDTLILLLEHGADAQARDNNGNTPAHLAASTGGDYRIQILDKLSQYCNLRETNNAGQTPLDLARINNHGRIVEWLQNFDRQPLTLQFLTRRLIRMRVRRVQNLEHLLPPPLIEYLHGR